MTTLRFRNRMLHQTLFRLIRTEMTNKGWATSSALNMNNPFRFIEVQPDVHGLDIQPNVISISLGDPGPKSAAEVGDGLITYDVPCFIDIYGSGHSMSESVGSDVMDILEQYHGTSQIQDYTDPDNPVDSDDTWSIDEEQGPLLTDAASQATDFRKFWRVCRFMVHVEYVKG